MAFVRGPFSQSAPAIIYRDILMSPLKTTVARRRLQRRRRRARCTATILFLASSSGRDSRYPSLCVPLNVEEGCLWNVRATETSRFYCRDMCASYDLTHVAGVLVSAPRLAQLRRLRRSITKEAAGI